MSVQRVLFLQPPSPPFRNVNREYAGGFGICTSHTSRLSYGHSDEPLFNIPFATAAGGVERDGHDVHFLDAQAESLSLERTLQHVETVDPDCLVMLASLPSMYWDIRLLQRLRKRLPEATTIVAGPVCGVLPEAFLGAGVGDYVVTGEPEVTIPSLVGRLAEGGSAGSLPGVAYRRHGQTCRVPAACDGRIDDWPDVPYHLLPVPKYRLTPFGERAITVPIATSKGCGFACAYFCPYPLAVGSKVRFRSPSRVVDEIAHVQETYGVSQFVFRDQNFTLRASHASEICRGVVDRGLKLKWVCETRLDLVPGEGLLHEMRRAGCRQINFGMESGSQSLFESVGKPGAMFGEIRRTIELVRHAGIATHLHLIIGLPGENWQTVRETADVVEGLGVDSIQLSNMIAYPGTAYFEEAEKRGWLLTHDYARYGGSSIVVRTDEMPGSSLFLARLYLRRRLLRRRASAELGSLLKSGAQRAIELVLTGVAFSLRRPASRAPEDSMGAARAAIDSGSRP